MGLLPPEVLSTLLVAFVVIRLGFNLHLWRVWTSGLSVVVSPGNTSSPGEKKKNSPAHAPSPAQSHGGPAPKLWPLARVAALGMFEGMSDLRDFSNLVITAVVSAVVVGLSQLWRTKRQDDKDLSFSNKVPSSLSEDEHQEESRQAQAADAVVPGSIGSTSGWLAPLPLLVVAFFYITRLQWLLHRRFLKARQGAASNYRNAIGFFVGLAVAAIVMANPFFGQSWRFEFSTLLPFYFHEMWRPIVEASVLCDLPSYENMVGLWNRFFTCCVWAISALFIFFLGSEIAVSASPIQAELNLVQASNHKSVCIHRSFHDTLSRMGMPLRAEKLAPAVLLPVLPFLWMPSVYTAFIRETGLSLTGFAYLRLGLVLLLSLILIRRGKIATQVTALIPAPSLLEVGSSVGGSEGRKGKSGDKKQHDSDQTRTTPSSSTSGGEGAKPQSSEALAELQEVNRTIVLRLLDFLALPTKLLVLVTCTTFLMLLLSNGGRPSLSHRSLSSLHGLTPQEIHQEKNGEGSTPPTPSSVPIEEASSFSPLSPTSATSPSSSSTLNVQQKGEQRRRTENEMRVCRFLWLFIGSSEQRRASVYSLGQISFKEKISWAQEASTYLFPFGSPVFVSFLLQLSSLVLVGYLMSTALLFSLESSVVRRLGIQRLSIWNPPGVTT
ncbi:transmembrane protein [Cystoisospora suis]|uniref:Transmembrane protein n=1 Tax=Cystoisospora suis TaxID=483139 RepID=A0A2C6LCE8_9APIC|nr:transmembrane protein [Cystoisospora suis]